MATRVFRYCDKKWGPRYIDRFASFENKQLPRYNAKWRDKKAEALDSIHLTDREWRQEANWCNPPWFLLDDLTAKLRQSSEGASLSHRPKMASLPVVRPLPRDGLRDGRNAPLKEHFLSTAARGARGGRAFRLERRGL